MATMNVSLPEQMKSWVEQQSEGGRFANSSDYVRDLIRRDQERGGVIAELQAAIDAGLNSGPAAPFDPAHFKQKMHKTRGQ
ncbi:MAG: type II toxin-antitoxin system ParD family antitoxin [Paracoccaceae bacterium]